jgi:purine-binding chemotaxis protein CheW
MWMKALSFFAGGEWFAANVAAVSKVARNIGLTPVPAAPEEVAGIAGIRGKVITMLDLAALRGAKPATTEPGRRVNAVVFKGTAASPDEMGLVIDKTGDIFEIDGEPEAGRYEADGVLYSVVDVNLINSRFNEGMRRSAAERQRGMGNE